MKAEFLDRVLARIDAYAASYHVDAVVGFTSSTTTEHRKAIASALAATQAPAVSVPPAASEPKCPTCNDIGMIGGPSFYAPDEGGVPCPDCSEPAVAVQAEPKAVADHLVEANPYPTYTFVAQNAAVEQDRAERYARTLLLTALAAHPKPAAPATADHSALIEELETAAARLTQRTNSPLDGLLQAAADALRASTPEPAETALLAIDHLIAKYHAEVWAAAEGEEPTDYDMAGVDTAKQLRTAIAALVGMEASKPAKAEEVVSDAEIIALWPQFKIVEPHRIIIDFLPFARAVLALRSEDEAPFKSMEHAYDQGFVHGQHDAQVRSGASAQPAQAAAAALPEAVEAINLAIIRKWPEGFEDRLQHVWLDVVSFIPSVKLYDLQCVLAEFGFVMEVRPAAPEEPTSEMAAEVTEAVERDAARLEGMRQARDAGLASFNDGCGILYGIDALIKRTIDRKATAAQPAGGDK